MACAQFKTGQCHYFRCDTQTYSHTYKYKKNWIKLVNIKTLIDFVAP